MTEKRKAEGLLAFLGARGRLWVLLGGLLAGILLILLGSGLGEAEEVADTLYREDLEALLSYKAQAEKEIASLCAEISGVSHPEVMLQLAGGTRVIYATDASGKPVSVGSGSSEEPLYVSIRMPEIAGIAVVCRGGNDPAVQKRVIDVLSTALGLPANRVAVTGK